LAKAPRAVRTKVGEKQQHRPIRPGTDGQRARRASANRTLTTLKAALNRLWRDGKVASDKAWRSVEPFESVDAARVRYLTVAEAKRLLNAAGADFRKLVQGALITGARYGELTALQVRDFNLDSGTIAIRQSKSGKPRHVVLTEEGVRLFQNVVAGRDSLAPMFLKPNGDTWHATDQVRPMADACKAAKIVPPIGFHGLRHTWASLAVMAGMPLMVVARNLGHADTRMVERHYGHLAPSYIADAIRDHAPRFGTVTKSKVRSLVDHR
jgi:integrase